MKNLYFTRIPVIILAVFATSLLNPQTGMAQGLPMECYDNQSDYSFMWWKRTIKTGNQVFAIKTNSYSLAFDNLGLDILDLGINRDSKSGESVLRESNAESFPRDSPCELKFGMKGNGQQWWCETSSGSIHDCQLIETGKYFQRRFINRLPIPGLIDCGNYTSGLEISSWPDRLSFLLKAIPVSDLEDAGASMHLTFPSNYSISMTSGDALALKDPSDGSGFVILKSEDANSISIAGTTVKVIMDPLPDWPAGMEKNTGMIIYPVARDIDSRLNEISEEEARPLAVTAEQIAPIKVPLEVNYQADKGWHQVGLRNDETESRIPAEEKPGGNVKLDSRELNNRMERVRFTVENPSGRDRVVRLNFAKGRLVPGGNDVFAIFGLSAILRDLDGNPVGIPVQISKNWHGGGRTNRTEYFRGPWYHGISVLTIPARSSLSLEYTSVNALWGGLPAASHGQLCLVGWGYNQQWDEAAIGAWGESVTYEPDLHQAHAPVLDFRPLLTHNKTGKMWGWTGNIGGADFFNYTKTDGKRSWHSRIRTRYNRYCPNLTEVTYAGTMDDESMDFEYTATVERSDDICRGIYKIKLEVLEDTDFMDFVVFQAAAASYHQVKSHTLAWGDEEGLKSEWKSTIGENPGYITERTRIEGKLPWFSFTDSENAYKPQGDKFLSANRGFVIRSWKARINGKDNVLPWFAEYNTAGGNYGDPSSIINILPPKGCTSFKAGDYIEAEIDLFILPREAGEYYGPNRNLLVALSEKANTWKMVYREAVGNNLAVDVSRGTLLDDRPVKIKAEGDKALFSIAGGLGHVPLTISHLSTYRNPELYRNVKNRWRKVDQKVHGNDFWQTDYDAETGTWDITYNVDLDTPGDEKQKVEFRFGK